MPIKSPMTLGKTYWAVDDILGVHQRVWNNTNKDFIYLRKKRAYTKKPKDIV